MPKEMFKISGNYRMGSNIIGLVVFAIVFGIVISMMKKQGEILLNFFTALSEAMMYLTRIVIWWEASSEMLQSQGAREHGWRFMVYFSMMMEVLRRFCEASPHTQTHTHLLVTMELRRLDTALHYLTHLLWTMRNKKISRLEYIRMVLASDMMITKEWDVW